MNTHSTEESGNDSDPELISGLTQLFHDRANRFEERPMSYERLQAAAIAPPTGGRATYLLTAAAILFVTGSVAGLTIWGVPRIVSSDPIQGVVVADEDDGQIDPNISSDANDDVDGTRSTFGDLTPTTSGNDEVAIDGESDRDESSSDSSASKPSSGEPSNPEDPDAATSETTTSKTSRPDATTSTTDANSSATPTEPSTSTTTGPTEPTTAAGGEQLASPSLPPLVPHHTGGQAMLSVVWDPVPGATAYEKVYSLDGVAIIRPATEGAQATEFYRGATGRQYCLRVVATSPTRPDSEPSVVCSVNAGVMNVTMSPILDGDSTRPSGMAVSWTVVEGADRYEVLKTVNGQAYELVATTAQPRADIGLNGQTGSFCVILRALDAGGSRIQTVAECTDIQP